MKEKSMILKLVAFFLMILFNMICMAGEMEFSIRNVEVAYTDGDSLVISTDNSVYDIGMGPDGRVYIPDYRNNRILILDKDLNRLDTIKDVPSPHGIIIDDKGFIYAATYLNSRILKFDPAGEEIKNWDRTLTKEKKISKPLAMAIDIDNNLLIADYGLELIVKASADGEYLGSFTSPKIDAEGSFLPHGISVDDKGFIYVADRGSAKAIHVFTSSGEHENTWQYPKDNFDPFSVRSFGADMVLVPDYKTGKIFAYTLSGEYTGAFGTYGSAPGEFLGVTNLIADEKGNIYTVEFNSNRVQRIMLYLNFPDSLSNNIQLEEQ